MNNKKVLFNKICKNAKKSNSFLKWLSYKEHIGDALALGADEGRDKLR